MKLLLPLLMWAALPQAQAQDPALLGCWRSQHLNQHLADGDTVHVNADCVLEFGETEIRAHCANNDSSLRTTLSRYRLTAPGHYEQTVESGLATDAPAQPRPVSYVVDGDWLTISLPLPAGPGALPNPPVKLESLSVRVPPSGPDAGCEARGSRATRVGRGRTSSLRIAPPAGFTALQREPSEHSELRRLVRDNTLIGIFVPGDTQARPVTGYRHFLVAVEDTRSGTRPVKPADFPAFKTLARGELNAATMAPTSQHYLGVSCDSADRICFDAAQNNPGARGRPPPATGYVTALYLNVKGRVVIIYGVADGGEATQLDAARSAAHALADRMRQLNP